MTQTPLPAQGPVDVNVRGDFQEGTHPKTAAKPKRAPFSHPLTPRECVELDIESGRMEYDWFNRP